MTGHIMTSQRPALDSPTMHSTPVRFSDVTKRFGRSTALAGVTLDIPAGRTTCIVGPSGSGKSTLLRCTNLLEVPDAGTIRLGDVEITARGVDLDALRTRIGMVFQNFHLFPHHTVLNNVTLAQQRVLGRSRDEAVTSARAHLDSVGLSRLEDRRPEQLSGGQQQRVAIARALAMEPEVMLFDEATSALDPELVKGVLAVMRELAGRGMTMIVVTHEMRFAREVAQQVVFLDQGRLLEAARPAEFFDSPRSDRLRSFLKQVL